MMNLETGIPLHDYYKDPDPYFGIYRDDGDLMLGDKVIEVDPYGNITLANHSFKGTPGLWEMIMERNHRVNDIPMVDK